MWKIEKTVKKGKYMYAVVIGHPFATKHGYVLLHRVLVENKIGRLLTKDEEVHHVDFNSKNNDIENLQVLTKTEHRKIHSQHKKRTFVDLKCSYCGISFKREKRQVHKTTKNIVCSRPCYWKMLTKTKL